MPAHMSSQLGFAVIGLARPLGSDSSMIESPRKGIIGMDWALCPAGKVADFVYLGPLDLHVVIAGPRALAVQISHSIE